VHAGSALRCISLKAAYSTLFVTVETHAKARVCVGLVDTSSMQERPPYSRRRRGPRVALENGGLGRKSK
jgi:hypothetical protein